MATKANHHYIPQFYLRNFSVGIGRQAQVFVFDSKTKKSFTTLVRNIGSRRNFNRVEAHDVGPNHIEDAMSEIETVIAPHLRQVIEAQSFPSSEHFDSIMSLMAFLSVRNPRLRGKLSDFHKDVVDRIMSLSVSTKEIWESQIKQMRESGVTIKRDIPYEEMKRFHDERNYEIAVDQTHLIGLELKMVEPVLKELSRRKWCFARASEGQPFITCDDPVVLSWTEMIKQPNPWPPGHGLQNTIVMFTLAPELALIGLFESQPDKLALRPEQVVALNTAVARHSEHQIYARDSNFMLRIKNDKLVRGGELTSIF
jgi:hypothetical protein